MFVDITNTDKKYNIIYADPPWAYSSEMAPGKGAKRASAKDYYPTMSIDEICALPIPASSNCILFLWVTMPKLFDASRVIESWGFNYKTCAFVWVKRNKILSEERIIKRGGIDDFMGQGRWTRQNAEFCLLATKGRITRQSAKVRQIVYSPIRGHSQKPDEVRNLILELCGDLPRIELFARSAMVGWDCWGDEAPNTNIPALIPAAHINTSRQMTLFDIERGVSI